VDIAELVEVTKGKTTKALLFGVKIARRHADTKDLIIRELSSCCERDK
jgi:hypothetical protein